MSEQQDERKAHAHLYYENKAGTADSFDSRWDELRRLADFRPTDRVRDVGCAEGPVALEVGPLLHVHGFDISPGRIDVSRAIGEPELTRLLAATRRQLVARVALQRDEPREANLLGILDVRDANGFDGPGFNRPLHEGAFLRGNILVAGRRGSDARSGELPPVALVPRSRVAAHPVVAGAESLRAPQGE